jgi:hypothetical protein
MFTEILEYSIIIYCCYDMYKNINIGVDVDKVKDYFKEVKNNKEYLYKNTDDNNEKYMAYIEKNMSEIILNVINKNTEFYSFYRIDDKIKMANDFIINKKKKFIEKNNIYKNISKKNNIHHSDLFKKIVDTNYNNSQDLSENKKNINTKEEDDSIEKYIINDTKTIDDKNDIKLINCESLLKSKPVPKVDMNALKILTKNDSDVNMSININISKNMPEEVDISEIDFGNVMNNLINKHKKAEIIIEKKNEKIKIKVGKRKKIN